MAGHTPFSELTKGWSKERMDKILTESELEETFVSIYTGNEKYHVVFDDSVKGCFERYDSEFFMNYTLEEWFIEEGWEFTNFSFYYDSEANLRDLSEKTFNREAKSYKLTDGIFRFCSAIFVFDGKEYFKTFRVKDDSSPIKRVREKEIKFFDFLYPASEKEILLWFAAHDEYIPEEGL